MTSTKSRKKKDETLRTPMERHTQSADARARRAYEEAGSAIDDPRPRIEKRQDERNETGDAGS